MKTKTHFQFIWQGIDVSGARVSGILMAESKTKAKIVLANKKIACIHLQKKYIFLNKKASLTQKHVLNLTKELSLLLKANISIEKSLSIIEKNHHRGLQLLIQKIKQSVIAGNSLTQTLNHYPEYFDTIYINLIRAGEQTTNLPAILEYISEYKTKQLKIRSNITKALYYPVIVLTSSIFIFLGMIIFIIPQFQKLFSNYHSTLPKITLVLISLSQVLMNNGLAILMIFAGLILGLRFYYRNNFWVKNKLQQLMLGLPFIGSLLKFGFITRWAMILGVMAQANVPLLLALKTSIGSTQLIAYQQAIQTAISEITAGQTLSSAIQRYPQLFPNQVIALLEIGENTRNLDEILFYLTDIYQNRSDQLLDALSHSLEPIFMIIIALIIGVMLLAMYLPIFRMNALF